MRIQITLSFLFLMNCAFGQILIDTLAFQDFEIVPQAPTWTFTGPVIYNSGYSSISAAPPSSPLGIGGSRAWETTVNSGGLILDFDNIIIPNGYDSMRVHFNLAAMNLASNSGGPDDLDYVLVAYSIDGGSTYTNRMRIRGSTANNSFWAYSATGVAKVFYTPAAETVFQPTTVGLQTTFGYSNCEIVFPSTVTQIKMRITGRSSSSTDTWLVDNLLITGESLCTPSTATISASACGSYTSPSGNNTWTSSGTYLDTIPNSVGCDSVITISLTVNNATGASLTGQYCDSLVSPSGNYIWTQSGLFYDTIPNSAGCDSIIVANIVVFQSSSSTITPVACDTYISPAGTVYTSSGTFIDVINNASGCDSIITVQLTINNLVAGITQNMNTVIATPANATYQWIDCGNGGAPIPGATNQSFTPVATGLYGVIVSDGICTDTASCVNVIIVANAAPSQASISIAPNPARGSIVIAVTADLEAAAYDIMDMSGRVVLRGKLSGPQTQVALTAIADGSYLFKIDGAGSNVLRFVKQD